MSTQTTTKFDLQTFTRAIEERDSATQLEMYGEDAAVTLVDHIAQPGSPRVLHGKGEVRAWIEDVCARDMTHRVQNTVLDENGAAFSEACRYPDATNVLCVTVLTLTDGQISSQIGVQAWDDPASV
jgi:SnoaL-like domain